MDHGNGNCSLKNNVYNNCVPDANVRNNNCNSNNNGCSNCLHNTGHINNNCNQNVGRYNVTMIMFFKTLITWVITIIMMVKINKQLLMVGLSSKLFINFL